MDSVKKHILSGKSFKSAIPPKVQKALIQFWGSEEIIDQPEIIVDLGPNGIRRIKRIGSKSLYEIAKALNSFDYIPSVSLWLVNMK